MTAHETLARIADHRLVLVVRGARADDARRTIAAAVAGGVRVVEVTFTVPDALEVMTEFAADDRLLIGAGTLVNAAQAADAIAAGARFLVSPGLEEGTVRHAVAQDTLIVPGTFTPTEVMAALAAGAPAVKLFPAGTVGPTYLSALHGPFPGLKVIPSGGVNTGNAATWLAAGAVAVGIGGALSPLHVPDQATADRITQEARRALAAVAHSGAGASAQ